jgi:hypothetical protein
LTVSSGWDGGSTGARISVSVHTISPARLKIYMEWINKHVLCIQRDIRRGQEYLLKITHLLPTSGKGHANKPGWHTSIVISK